MVLWKEPPLENILGKKEHADNQHFLLFPQCFLKPQNEFQFLNHIYFVFCKCFQFEHLQNVVVLCKVLLKPFPKRQILDFSKFTEFADDDFEFQENS